MLRCLLLLALLCQAHGDTTREPEKHQVVVVGAGVSGFTAAATLLEHNVTDLILLEASDRIGGRTHTVEFGGVAMEKGAEFVREEEDNAVLDMVKPYDLLAPDVALTDKDKTIFADLRGHTLNSSLIMPLVDKLFHITYEEGMSHCNGSVGDYFYPRMDEILKQENVDPKLSEGLGHLIPLLGCSENALDDLYQMGAWGASQYQDKEGDRMLKWKKGGYKTLYDFISKKFPKPEEELPVVNKTVFGKQVTRVERRETDVLVTCADGSTYLADHVIITVSLGVLKKHAADMFHPALPDKNTAAIESLGFGCLGKVFLLFPNRWWTHYSEILPILSKADLEEFRTNPVHSSWTSNATGFFPVLSHDRMLCVWFAGQACRNMDTLTDEEVIDGLMELLNKLVGKNFNVSRPEAILRSSWASYPYTLGAYSYRSVDSDRLNITNTDLAQPVLDNNGKPMILFAGEATHPYHSGCVHGALSTGRREANNLLNYLNKHSA